MNKYLYFYITNVNKNFEIQSATKNTDFIQSKKTLILYNYIIYLTSMITKINFRQTRIRNLLLLLFVFTFLSAALSQIPSGYYSNIEGKSGATLKTALHQIICNDTTGYLLYGTGIGSTWQGFYNADRKVSNDSVLDMYSDIARYFPNPNNSFVSVSGLNIEHSLPKSWWGGAENAAYHELHHLFPSDANANTEKSNYPMGVVTGSLIFNNGRSKVGYATYSTYSGLVFEPHDDFKGDFARAYLYMATAYENYSSRWNSPMMNNNTYPVFNTWAINVLLDWHRNDPVSQKEITRNNVVYSFQNNRNPYIDYPDLAEHIWGNYSTVPFYFINNSPDIEAYSQLLNSNTTVSFEAQNSVPVTQSINIRGNDLIGNILLSISGTNANLFSVSSNVLTISSASAGAEIIITYSPTLAGNHSAILTITSTNAIPFILNLSGSNQ